MAAAKARAYQDKINKLTSENIDLEEKQVKALQTTTQAYLNLNDARKSADQYGGSTFTAPGSGGVDVLTSGANSAKVALENAQKASDALTDRIQGNKDKMKGFMDDLAKAVSETGNLKIDGTDALANNLKDAKAQTDALAKSQNTLQAALKQVDSQLQSGQITSLEAAKQKLNAYQKDLQTLFQHGGGKIKIDADLSGITDLQKQIKELTAADVLKKLNEALNIDAQLNTAGATTQLEKVKSDLNAAKQAFKDLVSGKNALSLDDSKVIKVKNEAADLEKQLQALTKQQKIDLAIKTGDAKGLDISQDLQNGWLTPLEAAKERVKALETELKALQKAGADSSVIIPVKIKWAGAKQDSAVAEVNEILNQSLNKFEGTSITIKQAVDLQLISNDNAIQQQIRNLNNHLRDLYKGLGKVEINSDAGKVIQQQIVETLQKIDVKKETEDINKKLNSQISEGLAGIGESIGEALSGGGFEGIFDGMMQSLGSQLETLGKWMIETATKFAILKEAFVKAIQANPVLGIAIGVATVALGAAIKNAFQNKQSQMAFADGGIVYGRTNAIIGEYQGAKNNPEVVAPLNKLKNILQVEQGGAQRVEVVGVIDNDVIRLASQRSDIKSRR